MPRIARVIIPGIPHHVTQRGNRRQRTFFADGDYQAYLSFLWAAAQSFDFKVLSYCLMPNHVHLLVVPHGEKSLQDGFTQIHQSYTRMVNRRENWTGCLWQGRFYSCPIQPKIAPFVARYIELNPVRANICAEPNGYRWSSAFVDCSQSRQRQSTNLDSEAFCSLKLNLQMDIASSESLVSILRKCTNAGRPLGSEHFISNLEIATGRVLMPRKRGRKATSNLQSLAEDNSNSVCVPLNPS